MLIGTTMQQQMKTKRGLNYYPRIPTEATQNIYHAT